MLYLTEILQKESVTAESAEKLGKPSALVWDNIAKSCLLQTEKGVFEKAICNGETVSVCHSVENADSSSNNEEIRRFCNLFVGQRVFDTNGKLVGEIENIALTQNLRLIHLQVGEKKFKRNAIAAVGDVVLVKEKSPKQIEAGKRETGMSAKSHQTPTAAFTENTSERSNAFPAENVTEISVPTPAQKEKPTNFGNRRIRRHYGDFNFLIGKTVDKNIVNFQGELMLKKGDAITKDVLRQAKISGKLIELYLHIE